MEEFNSVIQGDNKRKLPRAVKIQFLCNECSKIFIKMVSPKSDLYEVECPQCGGFDTELN